MFIKNILSKFIKSSPKYKLKVISDDSYCYSKIVWNCPENLIILVSFTDDYFEQVIEVQDAINHTLCGIDSKIIFSSYDEEITTKDADGNVISSLLIHKKYYMLIGGSPSFNFIQLYSCINNLGNEIINTISDEIINNCNAKDFETLINDGILPSFNKMADYDIPKKAIDGTKYTDPEILLKRLPEGFTGRDILKFILLSKPNIKQNAFARILDIYHMSEKDFKNYHLYDLYNALIKNVTIDKLRLLMEPLYKQPDDDGIPGDVSDESLDAIFRENYERFSAIMDDSIQYEDIDEELTDDESDDINNEEGDKV